MVRVIKTADLGTSFSDPFTDGIWAEPASEYVESKVAEKPVEQPTTALSGGRVVNKGAK